MTTAPPGPRLEVTERPHPAERASVAEALLAHNETFLGPAGASPLAVVMRDPAGQVVGGVWGRIGHGWLFIEMVFVAAAQRGNGLGTVLLGRAEAEARQRGCGGVWLDTLSPDALRFYRRLGYEPFGSLPDHPPGHTRWFLRKALD